MNTLNASLPLTPKDIGGKEIQSVSARQLYEALGLDKSNWSRWYKKNIVDNSFAIEDDDYRGFVLMTNGNETLDFALSIDFAKKLAMQVRTPVGEEVRNYFIECEKSLNAIVVNPKTAYILGIIQAPDDLTRAVAMNEYERGYVIPLEHKVEEQAQELKEAEPKVTYHDLVLACPDLMTVTEIAIDYGMSARKLNSLLNDAKIQYKTKSGVWVLYVKHASQGYAQTFTHVYQDSSGARHAKPLLKWTQKGRLFIYETLKSKGILPIVEQES